MAARSIPQPVDEDVFDLDAIQSEAAGKPFKFRVKGETFTALRPEDVDWLKNSAILDEQRTRSDYRPFFRVILGGEYERFARLHVSVRQADALINAYHRHNGTSVPESSAS
jgi:hypothetical protein